MRDGQSMLQIVAMAELNGPAYQRVGESLELIMEDIITERQLKYLKLEYLPIPRVNVKNANSNEYSLEPTKKQPVRYLMPKLHNNKQLPAFRGCLLYTSPSPRDATLSRMPSSA